jgi:hypothetical protein
MGFPLLVGKHGLDIVSIRASRLVLRSIDNLLAISAIMTTGLREQTYRYWPICPFCSQVFGHLIVATKPCHGPEACRAPHCAIDHFHLHSVGLAVNVGLWISYRETTTENQFSSNIHAYSPSSSKIILCLFYLLPTGRPIESFSTNCIKSTVT